NLRTKLRTKLRIKLRTKLRTKPSQPKLPILENQPNKLLFFDKL
ncbi:MAG: hypothetical protein ACI945_001575, partial [Pseudohongiellaceae bacterium]